MLRRALTTLTASLALVATGLVGQAMAQECDDDADCKEGLVCQMESAPCASAPCEPGQECDPPDCPDPVGKCVEAEKGECATDADCGEGYTCEIVGEMGTACACPDGAEECDCPEDPETTVFYGCVPKPCETDADCGDGYLCKKEEYEICSGGMAPAPDCAPGEECGGGGGSDGEETEPECTTESYSWCEKKPCESDAECGEGFHCEKFEYEICSGAAPTPMPAECAPGEDCGSDDGGDGEKEDFEPSCETVTDAVCAPDWFHGCESDTDCDADFECKGEEVCSCSGSAGGGSAGSAGGSDGAAPPSEGDGGGGSDGAPPEGEEEGEGGGEFEDGCSCEEDPDSKKYCIPKEIECTDTAECPADWTCETWISGGVSTEPVEVCEDTPEGGTECKGGDEDGGASEEEEIAGQCLPPGTEQFVRALDESASGGPTSGGGAFEEAKNESGGDGPAPGAPGGENESPEPPEDGSEPGTGDGSGTAGADDGTGDAPPKKSSSGGCQGTDAPAPLLPAVVLALLALAARRREA